MARSIIVGYRGNGWRKETNVLYKAERKTFLLTERDILVVDICPEMFSLYLCLVLRLDQVRQPCNCFTPAALILPRVSTRAGNLDQNESHSRMFYFLFLRTDFASADPLLAIKMARFENFQMLACATANVSSCLKRAGHFRIIIKKHFCFLVLVPKYVWTKPIKNNYNDQFSRLLLYKEHAIR